jgi:hypothetical protein
MIWTNVEQPEQHIRFASVSCKLLDGSSGNYYAETEFMDSRTDFDFHFDCIGIVIHEYDVSATASIPGYFMTFGPQRKTQGVFSSQIFLVLQ